MPHISTILRRLVIQLQTQAIYRRYRTCSKKFDLRGSLVAALGAIGRAAVKGDRFAHPSD